MKLPAVVAIWLICQHLMVYAYYQFYNCILIYISETAALSFIKYQYLLLNIHVFTTSNVACMII